MGQILLISADETINSLYPININIYLNFDVTLKINWKEAKNVLDLKPKFDLIIVQNSEAKSLLTYLKNENITLPIFILGQFDEMSVDENQIAIIKNRYKLQEVIRKIAKLFNITAQIMANKKVADYYPISLKLFNKISKTPVSIFIKDSLDLVDSPFAKIADKGVILEKILRICKSKNLDEIYVHAKDRLIMVNEITEKIQEALMNKSLSIEQKLELNEQGFELACEQIADMQIINDEIIKLHKICIESSKEIAKKIPQLKTLLDTLVLNKSGYIYTHSILISFICNHMVKYIPWGGHGHADKLAYISFYHDLFLAPLCKKYPKIKQEQDLLRFINLTKSEEEVVLNHARMIGEIVGKFPRTPIGSDVILRQHHGEPNGIGFAVDFREDLSPLAKVFIVAESYVDEILKEQNYPINEKLNLDKFNKKSVIDQLYLKFTRTSYKKIIDTLNKVPI